MIQRIDREIPALTQMKKYPEQLSYIGDTALLERPKVSIVGTRRPSHYTKQYTHEIAKAVIYNNKWYSTIINGIIIYAKN